MSLKANLNNNSKPAVGATPPLTPFSHTLILFPLDLP